MKIQFLKISIILLFAITSIFFTSCEKDSHSHDDDHDTENKVTISLTDSILTNYTFGDTIKINGVITAEEDIHGYQIQIIDKSNDSILFTTDEHAHGTSLTFSKYWVVDINENKDISIEIDVAKDHDGNHEIIKYNTKIIKLLGGIGGKYNVAIFPTENGQGVSGNISIKYAANKPPMGNEAYDKTYNTMVETGYGPHAHFEKLTTGTYFLMIKTTNKEKSIIVTIDENSKTSQDIYVEM